MGLLFAPSTPSLRAGYRSNAGTGARAHAVPVLSTQGSHRMQPACSWSAQVVCCTCYACVLPAAASRGVSYAWRSSAGAALAAGRFPAGALQSLPPAGAGPSPVAARLSGLTACAVPQRASTAKALDSVPAPSANGARPEQHEAGPARGAQLLGREQGQGAAGRSDGLHLATLMVQCADRKGVIAALAQLLYGLGCNIIASDQYVDPEARLYTCLLSSYV